MEQFTKIIEKELQKMFYLLLIFAIISFGLIAGYIGLSVISFILYKANKGKLAYIQYYNNFFK